MRTGTHRRRGSPRGGQNFILNPAPATDLRNVDLGAVFALTPNEREARVCLGLPADDPTPDHEIACRLLALGVQNVMLTRGVNGGIWTGAAGLRVVPALPVQVVDTVGAGDAFNAGLAVGLSEGKTTLQAIALGVTAASLSNQVLNNHIDDACGAQLRIYLAAIILTEKNQHQFMTRSSFTAPREAKCPRCLSQQQSSCFCFALIGVNLCARACKSSK